MNAKIVQQLMTPPKFKSRNFFLLVILIAFLFIFFSYRLADTPNGINEDEASYGYNGILLANSLRDQSGRFLPLFILGSDNVTWYAPYMQYLVALLFKILGPSVFAMRFATTIVTVASALLTLYFARLIFDKKTALITLASFVLIPEVMIETHTPLEHMIVVPFVLLWLIGLFKYKKTLQNKHLILAALSLGIGFYSYGGIRPMVAVWSIASVAYIAYLNWPGKKLSFQKLITKKFLTPLLTFSLTTLPFFAIIPVLEFYYAGAVMNNQSFEINSIYSFFNFYISNFDISFLFVTGDKLQIQSTLRHGMFLLSTLPIFAIGLYQAFRKESDYFRLLGIVFFATPLLFGFVGSIHFAHRLLYMVPFYTIFITLGVKAMIDNKNLLLKYSSYILFVLVLINYFDFWNYYMYQYPQDTYHIFHHLEDYNMVYEGFSNEAKERNLQPFMSVGVARTKGVNITDTELFSRAIYFPETPSVLDEQMELPNNAILLSDKADIKGLEKLGSEATPYNIFIRK